MPWCETTVQPTRCEAGDDERARLAMRSHSICWSGVGGLTLAAKGAWVRPLWSVSSSGILGEMIRSVFRLFLLAAAVLALAPSVFAQNGARDPGQEFVLPGDLVKLWIWREEALSGEFLVPPTGVVVFPKIGAQKVTDRPMP